MLRCLCLTGGACLWPPVPSSASCAAGGQYPFVSEAPDGPAGFIAALLCCAACLHTCMAPGGSQLASEPEAAVESLSASLDSCMACGAALWPLLALRPCCWLPSAPAGKLQRRASTNFAVSRGLWRLARRMSASSAHAEKLMWQHLPVMNCMCTCSAFPKALPCARQEFVAHIHQGPTACWKRHIPPAAEHSSTMASPCKEVTLCLICKHQGRLQAAFTHS